MSRKELIEKYKSYGCSLIACKADKEPMSKWTGKYNDKGKKIYSWKKRKGITYSDEEILAASRWGIDHEASDTIDADFDDKKLNAHKFSSLLPATHSIGKIFNGSDIPTPNHFLYFKPDNVQVKTESYPKDADKGKTILELLPNTQSRYIGKDLHITNDIPPKRLTQSQFQQVEQAAKEIYFMSRAVENYPAKDKRNKYII